MPRSVPRLEEVDIPQFSLPREPKFSSPKGLYYENGIVFFDTEKEINSDDVVIALASVMNETKTGMLSYSQGQVCVQACNAILRAFHQKNVTDGPDDIGDPSEMSPIELLAKINSIIEKDKKKSNGK